MSLLAEKVIGATLILFVPFIIGLIFPATLYRSGRRPNLEFINCISTGLLMGIFLLHILPNATGQLREALEDTRYECYPIGEFLAGLGFFIVIGFELVIITYQNKHKIPSRADSFDEIDSEDHEQTIASLTASYQSNGAPMFFENSINSEQTPLLPRLEEVSAFDEALTSGKVYVLLFGLSIHSLFEGLVIGFEKDHGGMWTVLITILVHTSLLAFSLGLSAFKVFHHFKNCLYAMIIFCISSPIGVLIGTLLKELLISKKRTDIVLGSLSCVAAGTFIFLVFMELIPENIKINKPGKKIIAVFVGFFVISIVEIFI